MSEDSNSSKRAEKKLSEKELIKIMRKSWSGGKPVSAEVEAALLNLAPSFYSNKVLTSAVGVSISPPAKPTPEEGEQLILARKQRDGIISSAKAEIDSIYDNVAPAVLDPASPTFKQDLQTEKKNQESWKSLFIEKRALFPHFPSLQKSEERVNEALRAIHALEANPQKSKKDPLSEVRAAWAKDDVVSDSGELALCDKVSKPENIALLAAIEAISVSEHVVNQKERILAAGKNAIKSICIEAFNDSFEHSYTGSVSEKRNAKARLKTAQKLLHSISAMDSHYPQLKEAREAVSISLSQPYFSSAKVSLACGLIESGRSNLVLQALSPDPGVVTGPFARQRIGQLLTSTKMTPETADWAVNYLGHCIRRADGEKRAKAISILVQESAAVPLARQRAIEEAASIAARALHADQREISKKLHEFSRKASLNTPEKTLFIDFAQEIRKYGGVDPKLFPTTVEERQKAGGAFKKDTTVIMTTFHTAVERQERAAKAQPPLTDLLAELEAPAAKPAAPEPTANVVLDSTVLLTPQTLANKFARGEDMVLEEMDPKIFAGQPAHRILNAANALLEAKIPEVETAGATTPNTRLELVRNRLVTSLLSELGEEDVLPVLEKRYGGKLPADIPPKTMLIPMLMGMQNDSEGLKSITREFLSITMGVPAEKATSQATPAPEPAAAEPTLEPVAEESASATEAEAPKPAPALPAPVSPEAMVAKPPARAPKPEPEYPQDISVRELLNQMEKSKEAGQLPDKSILKAMQTISNSQKTKHRAEAYGKILKHFLSEGGAGYTHIDMIRDISRHISLPPNDDVELLAGRTIAEGLLSMPQAAKWGPVESQEIRSILASADEEYVNPAVLNKLSKGNEAEKGEALLVLVERAELNGKAIEEGASLYEIALTELMEMGEVAAVPALFSLAESNCPKPLLLEFLTAYGPEVSGKEAIEIILAKRAEQPGAVFASETTDAKTSDEKAHIAIGALQFYGGDYGVWSYNEESVAKGAAQVPTPSAIKFLIQGMRDSEDTEGLETWKGALREISRESPSLAEETESLLMASFYTVGSDAMGASFDLLAERPSVRQADFFLTLAAAQNGLYSEKAKSVLADYDFSSLGSAERLAIMRLMHIDNMPPGKGAQLLKEFLPSHRADAVDWMDAGFLSGVFTGSEDPALATEAREALIATAEKILAEKHGISGVDKIARALSANEELEVSELATYALASEMRRQGDKFSPGFHKVLFNANKKFKKDDDTAATQMLMVAAKAAATEEALRQVLVPFLAADEILSDFSAKILLSSNEGAHQLALAAAMENHPEGMSEKGSLRISENAFKALSGADTELSSQALISLLRNKKDDLHLSAYEALQKSGDSKCPALLGLLSSGDSWEKYAAIKLLPQREEFVSKVMPLSIDADRSVSASAMDYVLSATGARGLASILSNPGVDEEIQQALSTYCARNKPGVSKELLDCAQTGGKEAEEAIRSLEFFPTDTSFPVLLEILDSGQPAAATARKTLIQMCWLLSTDADEEGAENAAYDIFEVYMNTSDAKVRNAIVDSARGPFAEFMLESVIGTGASSHAFPAFEIFLATENLQYAAEVAQYIRKEFPVLQEEPEGYAPLFQILFFHDLGAMAEVTPGSIEYKVLQEVAEKEFAYGQGSRESKELLFSFMKNFGSRQVRDSLFERGPLAVSEFLWSMRGDANEGKAVLWLRSMKDEDTNLLLDVLVEKDYSALDKLLENKELAEIVFSHAMRRALFSFAELSRESGIEGREKAAEGFGLYSQLLSKDASIGMPHERPEQHILTDNLGLRCMVGEGAIKEGEQMLRALCQNLLEISSLRASARAEARRLARKEGGSPEGERQPRRVRRITQNPS